MTYNIDQVDFERKAAGLLVVIAALFLPFGPYMLVYGVPMVTLGPGFGILWFMACYSKTGARKYGRVGIFIPLTLMLALLLLASLAPAGEGDSWNTWFNQFNGSWPMPWARSAKSWSRFGYVHVRSIVLLSVYVVAPIVFWFLTYWENKEHELAVRQNEESRERRFTEKFSQIEHDFKNKQQELKYAQSRIQEQLREKDEEIERLKLREKYLSESSKGTKPAQEVSLRRAIERAQIPQPKLDHL